MANPLDDPDNRFHAATIDEVNAKLAAERWAVGLDVMEQVKKAYENYLGGDAELADAQLASLVDALRRPSA